MCAIYTYTFFQSSPQIRENSLAHRSWDIGHFLANIVFELGNCRRFIGVNTTLEVPPQKKIQWREIWAPGRPWNVPSTRYQFSIKHFVNNCQRLIECMGCRTILLKPGPTVIGFKIMQLWKEKSYVALLCSDQNLLLLSGLAHFRRNGVR